VRGGLRIAGGHRRCVGLAVVSLLILTEAAEAQSLAALPPGQLPPVTVTAPETRSQKRVRQPPRERDARNGPTVQNSQPAPPPASGVTSVAFPHDTASAEMSAQFDRRLMVDGVSTPYMDNLAWPGLVTVANLPATVVPTRRLVGGLPAGFQIVGPYLGDRTTLKFAQLLEQQFGGFMQPSVTAPVLQSGPC
jgi:hypothetical protein